ncbi:hypothetical protein RHGRI_014833 [Rhododendron griersonianum]|uniref:Aminotransferase-like plant mobile domain-containing protein n=1 Tax=Rhododendron griersonianum TaxID=479676 RepID=A0AAV6KBH0_9ERIC|nr:hypothetical protein RHGRI_014833 [Rhododendron griersonianum]
MLMVEMKRVPPTVSARKRKAEQDLDTDTTLDPAYTEDLPLAARWLSRRETTMETTYHYRGMLDNLRPSQVIFDQYTGRRQVVADVVFYTGCIRAMAVLELYLPDRVLRQFGMVQLDPGPPLVPLRGSRGANSHSYNVVYAYTDGQWENWRDHVMNAEKRVRIQPGVPWDSHPDYLPWFLTVSHFRVSPRPVEVSYTESAEERNATAMAILDSVLGGTRATTSTCPYELRQALVEVQRTLRGPEAAEVSIAGPSSDLYSSRYTRCRRRDRT